MPLSRSLWRAPVSVSITLLALVRTEGTARAEEPPIETADGIAACREFDDKNDRELAAFVRQQPAKPYEFPRDRTVLGAPWGPFLEGAAKSGWLLLATAVPHVGAELRAGTPALLVSWPLSLPLGPAFTCTRKPGMLAVQRHRAHRVMLEPGIVSGSRSIGTFVRPGYRFLYQPSDWVVGAGGGLGSRLDLGGNSEPLRLSISPEAVIRFGHCCEPGYFTLAFRYDHFFAGRVQDLVGGSLGFVYF